MKTQVTCKYFTKHVQIMCIIFNFSKILYSLPSTLCWTGELGPLRFIWHHDLRVTHYQSSAITFVFTQYSFCNSIRHGLKGLYRMHLTKVPLWICLMNGSNTILTRSVAAGFPTRVFISATWAAAGESVTNTFYDKTWIPNII